MKAFCGRKKREISEDELYERKATRALHRELDIVHFIKRYRNIWNLLKAMSTRRERNLTKMQAERHVLILRDGDR